MEFDHSFGYDFSILPSHVLVNVLLRLKLPDFKTAVLTCKSWYYASCDPQITRHITIRGLNKNDDIKYLLRPIQSIQLNNVNMNKFQFRQLFTQFGETITDLEILMSTLPFTRIFEIFAYLPNVRTLRIYLVSNYFSSQNFFACKALQKHRDVISKNLGRIKYLTVHMRMRNLEPMKLFLSHCTNVEQLHWNKTIYLPNSQTDFLCDYLLEPREYPPIANVTDLLIGCINRDDNRRFFTKLTNVSLPKLRRLHIKEIAKTYYDVTFREFCKAYHYLDDLTINCCNEQQLHDICAYIGSIKRLRLEKCNANNLPEIAQLTRLEWLYLERVDIVRDDKLIELLRLKLPNLTKLTINLVDANILTVLCENHKNLEELDLKRVDTKNCQPIFRHLLKLKVLNLWFNEEAPCHSSRMDTLDECNITRLTKLEQLMVSCWVPGLTPKLIQTLPKLQLINLEDVTDSTDEELAEWAATMARRDALMAGMEPVPQIENRPYELNEFDVSLYNSIL